MNKFATVMAVLALSAATAQAETLVVNTAKKGAEISPTMYGLFFEDINYAADGGLYGELVKNRSFEFPQNLMGWQTFGNVELKNDGPFERNPHYVRLSSAGHGHKHTGLQNEGYFGMGVEKGEEYRFSVWARTESGDTAALRILLVDPFNLEETQNIAEKTLKVASKEWKKYSVVLTPNKTMQKAQLRIFLKKPDKNTVDLEHISLFPVKTFNGHENGLRADIAQKLADVKPGVFRFPGGCIVEGTEIPDRYQWKNTVGPVENRPTNRNRWEYTFPHRFYPDYFQSGGLGFYEYFLLSEEMGAEPLPVVNVGLVCQYQNNDLKAHVPVDSLDEYIQDAVDLVEFANGATDTKWGALRAEMGHPEPFGLKYLGVGNEQWGPEYVERLKKFVDVLRVKCPEIKIVGSSGPSPSGDKFDYLWPEMKKLKVDLVDEHYYANEDWFKKNAARYDSYDRKGPKVFAGEYACHGKGKKYNHFNASLLEAAFMTGLERNADIVEMATYAPLLAHYEGWQWRPDMIWFDNLGSVATASYYVQQMYAKNKGTNVLQATVDAAPLTGAEGQNGLYATAAFDAPTGDYIVKVVNIAPEAQSLDIKLDKLKKNDAITSVETITLKSDDPMAENTVAKPDVVVPVTTTAAVELNAKNPVYTLSMEPNSFKVLRFKK